MKIKDLITNNLKANNITNFMASVLPSVLNYFLISKFVFDNEKVDEKIIALCALISVVVTYSLIRIIPHILALFKCFRTFARYEGRWLQIIPDMKERPFTILDLKYNKYEEKYEIHGNNYSQDMKQKVDFDAYYIIERRFKNGFYYITDQTTKYTNGLGKVCFVQSNDDNLIRAQGYFFDASNKICSKKYRTYFVKCNKTFFNVINRGENYLKIRKMTSKKVMEQCIAFAMEELNRYSSQQETSNLLCTNCKIDTNQTVP